MFKVIQPPADEQVFAETSKRIFDAAHRLGMKLEIEGFLMAWVSGTRVIVEEKDGEIIALALVTMGRRWVQDDFAATLLDSRGGDERMFEFIKQIAIAMGSQSLIMQDGEGVEEGDKTVYRVVRYKLG